MYIIIALAVLCIILLCTYTENFNACTGTDCKTCSNQSGCSWCEKRKTCIPSSTVKSTDSQCNPLNVVSSSFLCPDVVSASYKGGATKPVDNKLYRDQIADRVRPPNVGLNDTMEYTPETVMGNINEIRKRLTEYNKILPDMISSSVENSIQPMVKGLLSSQYQRQCS